MPLDITITLTDEDLQNFQDTIDKGKLAVADDKNATKIEDSAAELIERARELDLPPFISDRLSSCRYYST